MPQSKSERQFHEVMGYTCDKCGFRIDFYLDDGCEGPRDVAYMMTVENGPFKGERREWFKTKSGRVILPVPFIAGGCPKCQPSGPPWHLSKGVLQHTAGSFTFVNKLTTIPANAGYFLYPPDPEADGACGIPYYPPSRVET